MARVRVGVLCVAMATIAGPARAQVATEQGWHVSVDFLNIVTRGNDVHVGDVFTEHQTVSGTATDNRLDYGVTYDPIVTQLDDDRSVMIAGGHRGPRWGFGARWWRATTEGAADGEDSTTPPTSTSQFLTGVRMWENSIVPVANDEDPSGISPVTFQAENTLEHMRFEAFAERLWLTGGPLTLATRFGFAHARTENLRSEGQTQRAFVVETIGPATSTLTNDITLESESELRANLSGPMVALVGDARVDRFQLEWLVGYSLLIGTANTEGSWIDIDDITEVTVAPGVTTTTESVLHGVLELEEDVRVSVPVLDLQVKGSIRATRLLSVGAGVFSSTAFSQPLAPAFVVPDDWTDVQGTGWRQQTRDLTMTGFTIFARVGF